MTPKQRVAARRRVLRDAGLVCHWCGRAGADTVDHVIPLSEGGPDTEANLAPIHARPCHVEKTGQESARARLRRRG